MTRLEALRILGIEVMPADAGALAIAFRSAARGAHPDHGGSASAFQAVQEAVAKLRQELENGVRVPLVLTIPLATACYGGTIELGAMSCGVCAGTGLEPGSLCGDCDGEGWKRHHARGVSSVGPCSRCKGAGWLRATSCRSCGGEAAGRVDIPPGTTAGAYALVGGRLSAEGKPTLDVMVEHHPVFSRVGNDLHMTWHVPFHSLCLGGKVRMLTLAEASILVHVAAGTQPGALIRLRGLGVPCPDRPAGDLLATVAVRVPRTLSERSQGLIREFGESQGPAVV